MLKLTWRNHQWISFAFETITVRIRDKWQECVFVDRNGVKTKWLVIQKLKPWNLNDVNLATALKDWSSNMPLSWHLVFWLGVLLDFDSCSSIHLLHPDAPSTGILTITTTGFLVWTRFWRNFCQPKLLLTYKLQTLKLKNVSCLVAHVKSGC